MFKHSLKNLEGGQHKAMYATSFGPEPEDEKAKKNRHKERASIYKDSLLNQIKSQTLNEKKQIKMEHVFENIVVDSHNMRLQEEEARKLYKDREQKA